METNQASFSHEPPPFDGSALAGTLSDVFVGEATSVRVTCNGCGVTSRLATAIAYMSGPGQVLRCRDCGEILGRLAQHSGMTWLDLRGITAMQIPILP